MKKWTACLLAFSLFVCLLAFSVAADEEPPSAEEVTTTTTTTEPTEETTTEAATTTTTVEQPQRLAVELEVAEDNGRFTIEAVDENGRPVADYPLFIQVGSLIIQNGKTDANGVYTSYYAWTTNKTLTYGSDEGLVVGLTTYLPVSRKTVSHPNAVKPGTVGTTTTTTTVTETTTEADSATTTDSITTTVPTDVPTSGGTTNVIIGSCTTSHQGDSVLTNVATDSTVLGLFGYGQNEFLGSSSFQISKSDYAALFGSYSSYTPLLNVSSATVLPSETMLNAAIQRSEELKSYSSNEHKAITFRLSLLVLDASGKVVSTDQLASGITCVVKLPVPAAMKNADKLAVTMPSEDGLATPIIVKPTDGCIYLQLDSLPENYTLIEFTEETDGSSMISLLLYIAGGLLIAGAGVLLYFFVFRKPKLVAEASSEYEEASEIAVLPEDDGDDIFSGRTDLPTYEKPDSGETTEQTSVPPIDED